MPALSSPGSFICYIKGSNSYLSRGSPNLLSASIWRTHTHTPRHFIRFPSFPIFHTCSVLSVEPIRSLALRVNIYWWFLKSATTSPSSLPVLNPPPSIGLNTTVPLSVEFVSLVSCKILFMGVSGLQKERSRTKVLTIFYQNQKHNRIF